MLRLARALALLVVLTGCGADDWSERAVAEAAMEPHNLARRLDLAGDAEGARSAYDAALNGYERFLALYPHSPLSARMRFFSGEALYETRQWQLAAQQYSLARAAGLSDAHAPIAAYSQLLAELNCVGYEEAGLPRDAVLASHAYEMVARYLSSDAVSEKNRLTVELVAVRLLLTSERLDEAEGALEWIERSWLHQPVTDASNVDYAQLLREEIADKRRR